MRSSAARHSVSTPAVRPPARIKAGVSFAVSYGSLHPRATLILDTLLRWRLLRLPMAISNAGIVLPEVLQRCQSNTGNHQGETVTAKLPGGTVKPGAEKSPQTGDNSNLLLWITLLFVSGGAVTVTTVCGRKKKTQCKIKSNDQSKRRLSETAAVFPVTIYRKRLTNKCSAQYNLHALIREPQLNI